jgi:hypothetical protein
MATILWYILVASDDYINEGIFMKPRPAQWRIELVKKGITLQELAHEVDCDISTLSKLGKGWTTPSQGLRERVAQALQMPVERAWRRV